MQSPPVERPCGTYLRQRCMSRPYAMMALLLVAGLSARPATAQVSGTLDPSSSEALGLVNVTKVLADAKALALVRTRANARPATPNQLAYDVHYYDLDLHPNPATHVLTASVRMLATVVSGPIGTLDLDFDSSTMTVDGVFSAGIATTFTHASDVLTVTLDRAYGAGERVDVVVQYHGTPGAGAFGAPMAFTTHNGLPMVWTISEPFDARGWWPCKDDAADKADSVDVRVTVPSGMLTTSNGARVESTDDGVSAVTRWHERHPIATYLVSIATYAYSMSSDRYVSALGDSMPIQFYLYPETVGPASSVDAKVKLMIAAFAARFGEYRFLNEKYGHAQVPWSGGMENQTCTSLGVFSEPVVAHELTHQWFGDAITCRDFHHIWLNEGFATFGDALWSEAESGPAAYHDNMNAKQYLGAGTIYVPDLTDPHRIFDGNLSYNKAAWVLHMLRHVLGDGPFFAAMKAYVQQYQYGTAATEDFQQVCESVSGLNLTKFFQQWIYGEYYPAYQLASSSAPAVGGGYDVTVWLQQTQTNQVFWMPADVRVTTTNGSFDFVARDSTALQSFSFHVPYAPTGVQLDPDAWILRTVAYPTDVGPAAQALGLRLAVPAPNPMRDLSTLVFSLPRAGAVSLRVLDPAGRRVAALERGRLPAGEHRVTWDGRGDDGRALRPGVYWVSLEFEGERRVRRLAIVY